MSRTEIVRELVNGEWVTTIGSSASGGAQPIREEFTFEDINAASGVLAATATMTSGGNQIVYTAVDSGISGNAIGVYSDVQASVGALTVEVSGSTITLHLKTDGDSNVLSTFAEVAAAVIGSIPASLLVDTDLSGPGDVIYDGGDAYLAGGRSEIVLATVTEGTLIWDAQMWFPVAWDTLTVLTIDVGNETIFSGADPDPSDADETQTYMATSRNGSYIDPAVRPRVVQDANLVLTVISDGGIPTQGEVILAVETIPPTG